MAKICILNTLLLLLLYTSVQGQNSPCPDIFTYIKKPGSDETMGQIEIRNPPRNNSELHLRVDIKYPPHIHHPYFLVNLIKSREDAVHDVLEGRPLLYHIYFSIQNPLPTVHKIWFNYELICSDPDGLASGFWPIIRKIYLLKINNHCLTNETVLDDELCGRSSSSGSPNLLIFNGKKTLRNQWPWLAAIFQIARQNDDVVYKYLCGGTVLTSRHILTAGHCLKTNTSETVSPDQLSVALGRYKLLDFNEEGSVIRPVKRIILHPKYTHTATADADLAIMILTCAVDYTVYIRPICLRPWWASPMKYGKIRNPKNGIVVGWGKDELGNSVTEEPRLANMPIATPEECLRSHQNFFFITSNHTFCAGWRNNSGPCNVDSGSGMVIFDSAKDRYELYGIVSRGLFDNQQMCDLTKYFVLVDVYYYLVWISNQIYDT